MGFSSRVDDADSTSRRWAIEPALACMLVELEAVASRSMAADGVRWPGLFIISGHRTREQQTQVNPTSPFSLHRRCPSLAADLRVGDEPASLTPHGVWSFLGEIWKNLGGKWGGDFTEVEPDLNHFYLTGTPVA